MQCDLIKQFFLLKDIYFKKKGYFCKIIRKRRLSTAQICENLSKLLQPECYTKQMLFIPYYI